MKKKFIIFTLIILAVLAIILGFLRMNFFDWGRKTQLDSSTIVHRIQEIQEFSLVEYNYTTVIGLKDSITFSDMSLPFTQKFFLATYEGKIKAGIDLRNASLERSGDSFHIILPHAKITSHQVDENSLVVYDESKNILNPIQIQDFNQAIAKEKSAIEAKAIASGILDQTEAGATKLIVETLKTIGVDDVKISYR